MSLEEFMAFFKEHPELVPRALELLRENKKNPTFLDSVGCTRKPSTPRPQKITASLVGLTRGVP